MKIGIVILNYLAYKVTMETVDSFMKQDTAGNEIKIIIVDNCSPNESYEKLCEAYAENPVVKVICTEKNFGFANGNNFGYQKLLDDMKPDFVIISNDDILLPQDGLYRWIIECYNKYGFAVLGPDVYSVNGKFHQNPFPNASTDIGECKKDITKLKIAYLKCQIKKLLHYTKYSGVAQWENTFYTKIHDDMTLHGSFQIFSSKYFEVFQEPFDSRTFLYHEEDIVRLRCDKRGLCCVYDPNYQVHHLQAVSTKMAAKNGFQRDIARLSHLIASMKVYMKVIEEEEGDGSESGKEQKLSKKTSR